MVPVTASLARAGHPVHAFDRDPARVTEAVEAGAIAADSAAASADIFLTSLPRPDHVQAVMVTRGAIHALRPGTT